MSPRIDVGIPQEQNFAERDYNLFKLRKKLEVIIHIHIRIRVS